MTYRLPNQRECDKQVDQRDDGRTIAAVSQRKKIFTWSFIHEFNDMAATSGEREKQFTVLFYWSGELDGVYIFKHVLCVKLFRVHSRLHRENTKSNPETEKEENQSY